MHSDRKSERISDAPQGGTFLTASRNREKQQSYRQWQVT